MIGMMRSLGARLLEILRGNAWQCPANEAGADLMACRLLGSRARWWARLRTPPGLDHQSTARCLFVGAFHGVGAYPLFRHGTRLNCSSSSAARLRAAWTYSVPADNLNNRRFCSPESASSAATYCPVTMIEQLPAGSEIFQHRSQRSGQVASTRCPHGLLPAPLGQRPLYAAP